MGKEVDKEFAEWADMMKLNEHDRWIALIAWQQKALIDKSKLDRLDAIDAARDVQYGIDNY